MDFQRLLEQAGANQTETFSAVWDVRYRDSRWRFGTRHGGCRAQLQRAAFEGAQRGKMDGRCWKMLEVQVMSKNSLSSPGCARHGCVPEMCQRFNVRGQTAPLFASKAICVRIRQQTWCHFKTSQTWDLGHDRQVHKAGEREIPCHKASAI